MTKFIVGLILGFTLATIGVSGIARVIDRAFTTTQAAVKSAADGDLDATVLEAKDAVKRATE